MAIAAAIAIPRVVAPGNMALRIDRLSLRRTAGEDEPRDVRFALERRRVRLDRTYDWAARELLTKFVNLSRRARQVDVVAMTRQVRERLVQRFFRQPVKSHREVATVITKA